MSLIFTFFSQFYGGSVAPVSVLHLTSKLAEVFTLDLPDEDDAPDGPAVDGVEDAELLAVRRDGGPVVCPVHTQLTVRNIFRLFRKYFIPCFTWRSAELDWHHTIADSPRDTRVSGSVSISGGALSLTEVVSEMTEKPGVAASQM